MLIYLCLFRLEILLWLLSHWDVKVEVSLALNCWAGRIELCLQVTDCTTIASKMKHMLSFLPNVHSGDINFLMLFPGFLPEHSLSWCYAETTPDLNGLALIVHLDLRSCTVHKWHICTLTNCDYLLAKPVYWSVHREIWISLGFKYSQIFILFGTDNSVSYLIGRAYFIM